jgi:hypothetical protein
LDTSVPIIYNNRFTNCLTGSLSAFNFNYQGSKAYGSEAKRKENIGGWRNARVEGSIGRKNIGYTKQKPIGSRGIRNRSTELGERGAGSKARTYGVGAKGAGHKELNHLEAGT